MGAEFELSGILASEAWPCEPQWEAMRKCGDRSRRLLDSIMGFSRKQAVKENKNREEL